MTQAEKDAHFAERRTVVPSFFEIATDILKLKGQTRATLFQPRVKDIEPFLIIFVMGADACEAMKEHMGRLTDLTGQGECGEILAIGPLQSLAYAMEWMENNGRLWSNMCVDLGDNHVIGVWLFHNQAICEKVVETLAQTSSGIAAKKVYE